MIVINFIDNWVWYWASLLLASFVLMIISGALWEKSGKNIQDRNQILSVVFRLFTAICLASTTIFLVSAAINLFRAVI